MGAQEPAALQGDAVGGRLKERRRLEGRGPSPQTPPSPKNVHEVFLTGPRRWLGAGKKRASRLGCPLLYLERIAGETAVSRWTGKIQRSSVRQRGHRQKRGDMPFLYTGIARLRMVKITVACCRALG